MADNGFPQPGVTALQSIGDWENFFHPGNASGVVPDVGSAMIPSLDTSGRNVVIQSGGAILRAFYKPVSAATYVPIPAASAQNRVDRLVLRLTRTASDAPSFITPAVITGTPAASPQVPAITRTTSGIWDLPIARWTSASNGSLSGLVDERVMISGPVLSMSSAGGTPQAERAGLLIQPDTGNLLMTAAAGGTWRTVFSGDTWHNGGQGANGWSTNASPSDSFPSGTWFFYKFIAPGVVMVSFGVRPSVRDDSTQILAQALPQDYWPQDPMMIPAYTDYQRVLTGSNVGNAESACLEITSKGLVLCRGIANQATLVFGNGLYSTDVPFGPF